MGYAGSPANDGPALSTATVAFIGVAANTRTVILSMRTWRTCRAQCLMLLFKLVLEGLEGEKEGSRSGQLQLHEGGVD
jgi:hypothetical protein